MNRRIQDPYSLSRLAGYGGVRGALAGLQSRQPPTRLYARLLSCFVFVIFNFTAIFVLSASEREGLKGSLAKFGFASALFVLPMCLKAKGWSAVASLLALFVFYFFCRVSYLLQKMLFYFRNLIFR